MNIQPVLWDGQKIDGPFSLDTETTNIERGSVPELVLWTANFGTDVVYYGTHETIDSFLDTNSTQIVSMCNAPFDLAVIGRRDLYEHIDRIHDIAIFWKLLWLAKSGQVPLQNSLAAITMFCMHYLMDKNPEIRMGWYRGMYISEERLQYACIDAYCTFSGWDRLHKAMIKHVKMLSYRVQIRGAVALADIERRGIGVNQKEVARLVDKFSKEMEELLPVMKEFGYVPKQKGNKKVLLDHISEFIKLNDIEDWPRTDKKGDPKASADAITKYATGDKLLTAYTDYNTINKMRSFIIDIKGDRVYPRYHLLKTTGRTSCSKPNLQNPPRKGGIRECYAPSKFNRFIIMDYNFIELCTLAQVCYKQYGYSKLREVINREHDYDPHTILARHIVGRQDVTEEERRKAKAANFGFPGGLGVDAFMLYAESTYGVKFTYDGAKEIRNKWMELYPEMREYLSSDGQGPFNIRTLTGRLRARATYTQSKNTPFQGLAADGAKIALWKAYMAGLKQVAFIHDEIIAESTNIDVDYLTLEKCMLEGMQAVVPDVKIRVEGKVCDRWEK